jgi:hypothetical protein
MISVTADNSEFGVDASVIGEGLGLDPARVLEAMRERRITSLCERGVGEDAGRSRLTFFFGRRRLRLVIDQAGNLLDRSIESVD